ncbi:MAG TPA: hypothetical protein VMB34_18755 [Acetobacteraceae bacterium]|nr:hypothetical protein [Acetobacteraceae bacterium]
MSGTIARYSNKPLAQIYKKEWEVIGPLTEDKADLYEFYGNQLRTEWRKPIDSLEPDLTEVMRNSQTLTGGQAPVLLQGVQYKMLQRLTTVIAQAAFGNGSQISELFKNVKVGGRDYRGQMTVLQFMQLDPGNQLAVIDQAWEKVCAKKPYNKKTSEMCEPTGAPSATGLECLPSAVIPKSGGYDVFKSPDAPNGKPFNTLGIGFRVEGSVSGKDIQRVQRSGMVPLVKVPALILSIRGFEVDGTVVARDTTCARFWERKHDIFNESAVCVTRNFFGATAFPLRDSKSDDVVLWAVDVLGLTGCDTEDHQVQLGGEQWRPGEKAYEQVPANCLVAYVVIQRTGLGPDGKGWKFAIDSQAQWTMSSYWDAKGRYGPVKRYIDGLLTAWRGKEHALPQTMDFANK